jgi:hypothetical protein
MDRTKAKTIIANQERGSYTSGNRNIINTQKVIPSDGDFLLPLPSAEVDFNPLLSEPAVDFDFENN